MVAVGGGFVSSTSSGTELMEELLFRPRVKFVMTVVVVLVAAAMVVLLSATPWCSREV